MTRKYWIRIDKLEGFETRFCITLLPFYYRKTPQMMRKMAFVSQRSFASERDAVIEVRALLGNVMIFKRDRGDRLCASLTLKADDV